MAVTKLKLLNISGNLKEFETALYMCINDPYLHIEDIKKVLRNVNTINVVNEQNMYSGLLAQITHLAESLNISLKDKLKTYEHIDRHMYDDKNKVKTLIKDALELNIDEVKEKINSQTVRQKESLDFIQNQTSTIREDERILDQIRHISNINVKFGDLFQFEFLKIRFGHMPKESYDSLHLYSKDMDDVFFIPSSFEKNEVWGLYIAPKSKSVRIDSLFSSLHFERVRIADRASGKPEEVIEMLTSEIADKKRGIESGNDKLKEIYAETHDIIEKYYEKIYTLNKMFDMRKYSIRTETSFHLMVWIPEFHVGQFTEQLEQLSTVVAPMNSPNDIPDITPPTLLKNNRLFAPFEQLVKMYGVPSYNEIDPTPVVAVTYVLFFGIMFGDLGQGIIIALAGLFMAVAKRMNFGRILFMIGLSSAAFGTFYGSVFGIEDIIHGYNPLEAGHINTVLITAVAFGVVSISLGILINILNGIKQKDSMKIIFSQNGLAGLIFYWSVLISALIVLNFIPLNLSAGIFIAAALLSLILIYLREPLTALCEKKKKLIHGNAVEFLVGNVFELFEIVLSFLTNTISFIRVGAYALNHVGMMSVVMLLAQTADGGKNPVVMIVGNIVVIALEGVLAAIQVLRLEYYEIFSRFFEGNGRSFESSGLEK